MVLQEFSKIDQLKTNVVGKKSFNTRERNLEPQFRMPNFDIVSLNMKHDFSAGAKYHRGHRLPSEKVDVLELWFRKNITKPYVTKNDLKMLVSQTSLSPIQVKNWLSNRRRKEKTTGIALSVTELLRTK